MTINLQEISHKVIERFKQAFRRENTLCVRIRTVVLEIMEGGRVTRYGLDTKHLEAVASEVIVDVMKNMLEVVEAYRFPQGSAKPATEAKDLKEMIRKEVERQVGLAMLSRDMGMPKITEKEVNEYLFGQKRRNGCPS